MMMMMMMMIITCMIPVVFYGNWGGVGYVKTQLNFTKFIMMTTCFGRRGSSSGHKITGKTICSVQTY